MTTCEGCGAPLRLQCRECEYCLRQVQSQQPVDDPQQPVGRYQVGWCNPQSICGTSTPAYHNAQGQAMADHYNYEQNKSRGWWNG